jgi:hypothetical protein
MLGSKNGFLFSSSHLIPKIEFVKKQINFPGKLNFIVLFSAVASAFFFLFPLISEIELAALPPQPLYEFGKGFGG